MNVSLPNLRAIVLEDGSSLDLSTRQLESLLGLFALYATALLIAILVADGPDIGCVLMGIVGHVVYAGGRAAITWRHATWLGEARRRVVRRRYARDLRAAYAR